MHLGIPTAHTYDKRRFARPDRNLPDRIGLSGNDALANGERAPTETRGIDALLTETSAQRFAREDVEGVNVAAASCNQQR